MRTEHLWCIMQKRKNSSHEYYCALFPKFHPFKEVQKRMSKDQKTNSDIKDYEFIIYDSIWKRENRKLNKRTKEYVPSIVTINRIKKMHTFTIECKNHLN